MGDYRDRWLWLHIMLGILAAGAVSWMLWFGFITFSAYQITQASERATERAHQQATERNREQYRQRLEQQRLQQYNSPQCKFWRNDYKNKGTDKALEKIVEHCP
ncbi:hypothetical protein [Marinobacterium rhizophilum]|uniref:Uncharacterized protein n=1 Tax=Marinobacterium rhizophilum TaxID=420402 RepID=A0ABY5HDJ4_9GAMM|nr:hypothetical protein [Marinobacterium rhizophilum]UTW10408.1 hypothetical protein KDW95_13995 [Marinobacterium rhizophilum]